MATEDTSLTNFGLVIAYVLPGFTALYGFPLVPAAAAAWGTGGDPNPPLTAFLSGTVMALAAGLTVSAVRWLVVVHYRYYKFYANMVVALVWAYAARDHALGWRGAAGLPLALLFFVASRDSLRKYYRRTGELLGEPPGRLVRPG